MITALVPDPKRAGRVDVVVDGESAGVILIDAANRLGISVGADFEPRRAAFDVERELLAVWDRATGLLAARARGRVELRRQLIRKGEPAARVDDVLDRLERAGYLDDAEFARQLARTKLVGAGWSRRRVAQELGRRGVARETADAAIDAVCEDEAVDQSSAAERLARKKLRGLERYDEETRRRRLYAFLARRGFESDEIREVLARIGISER